MQSRNNFAYNILHGGEKMRLFRKVAITFEGKTYEIRLYYNDTTINIVTFLNKYPANGLRYQIQLPKKCNIQGFLKEVLLEEFIEMSRKDIVEKRDQRLSAAIQKNIALAE